MRRIVLLFLGFKCFYLLGGFNFNVVGEAFCYSWLVVWLNISVTSRRRIQLWRRQRGNKAHSALKMTLRDSFIYVRQLIYVLSRAIQSHIRLHGPIRFGFAVLKGFYPAETQKMPVTLQSPRLRPDLPPHLTGSITRERLPRKLYSQVPGEWIPFTKCSSASFWLLKTDICGSQQL